MRFIIGFIFFGLLFYGIWLYFPETFQVLTSWAAKVFDFFKDVIDKIRHETSGAPKTPPQKVFHLFHYLQSIMQG